MKINLASYILGFFSFFRLYRTRTEPWPHNQDPNVTSVYGAPLINQMQIGPSFHINQLHNMLCDTYKDFFFLILYPTLLHPNLEVWICLDGLTEEEQVWFKCSLNSHQHAVAQRYFHIRWKDISEQTLTRFIKSLADWVYIISVMEQHLDRSSVSCRKRWTTVGRRSTAADAEDYD